MFWNNPAGGVYHHLRALRRSRAWQPFRDGLETWLERWRPERSVLAIVGPSAGYCIPLRALPPFERCVVFELDPVARFIFARRLSRAFPDRLIEFVRQDMWVEPLLRGGGLPSARLGDDAAVLFTNIIGQLPFLLEAEAYPRWQRAWREQLFPWLEHTPWASFHDRVSSDLPPYEALPPPERARKLNEAEISALYESHPFHDRIELSDHDTHALLPTGYHYQYLNWPLTRSTHHLIECTLGGPRGSTRPP